MSGNTFGRSFCVTSFGESHGPAIGGVIDGCPPGLALAEEDIQRDLDRRRPGQSAYASPRQEPDKVQILSGVFEGVTTGTPIALLIANTDQRSGDYAELARRFRPGHADYSYHKKYGVRDPRGGGRASARETAVRVAAGAVARKWLAEQHGVSVHGYLRQMGHVRAERTDLAGVESNPFFCPDPSKLAEMSALIDALRAQGDSVGALVEVVARGVPAGWGEPVYDKLDAAIAQAMMGINAVKGVEIGAGFGCVTQRGSEHRDELTPQGFVSNNSGGVLGGISSGQEIKVSVALKPTSSIQVPGRSVDVDGQPVEIVTRGRHDPCVGIRAVPIVEAMLALVLIDHALRHRAQCGAPSAP